MNNYRITALAIAAAFIPGAIAASGAMATTYPGSPPAAKAPRASLGAAAYCLGESPTLDFTLDNTRLSGNVPFDITVSTASVSGRTWTTRTRTVWVGSRTIAYGGEANQPGKRVRGTHQTRIPGIGLADHRAAKVSVSFNGKRLTPVKTYSAASTWCAGTIDL